MYLCISIIKSHDWFVWSRALRKTIGLDMVVPFASSLHGLGMGWCSKLHGPDVPVTPCDRRPRYWRTFIKELFLSTFSPGEGGTQLFVWVSAARVSKSRVYQGEGWVLKWGVLGRAKFQTEVKFWPKTRLKCKIFLNLKMWARERRIDAKLACGSPADSDEMAGPGRGPGPGVLTAAPHRA